MGTDRCYKHSRRKWLKPEDCFSLKIKIIKLVWENILNFSLGETDSFKSNVTHFREHGWIYTHKNIHTQQFALASMLHRDDFNYINSLTNPLPKTAGWAEVILAMMWWTTHSQGAGTRTSSPTVDQQSFAHATGSHGLVVVWDKASKERTKGQLKKVTASDNLCFAGLVSDILTSTCHCCSHLWLKQSKHQTRNSSITEAKSQNGLGWKGPLEII